MIRVLHVVTYMGRGGLETMLMNYYRFMDRENVQFDFLVHRPFEGEYDAQIWKMGGRIYHVSRLLPWSIRYRQELKQFFREHPEYRIIHVHLDCFSAVVLKCAKDCGVSVRIAHSHSAGARKDLTYLLRLHCKRRIPAYATDLLACGTAAGDWMFSGHTYGLMPNAIDLELFHYCKVEAQKVRQELHLEGCKVLGHVGRFHPAKNHGFLIKVFEEVRKREPDARLLLVGDGDGGEEIARKVREAGLENEVIFTGDRSDVYRLLQGMDLMVFPSLYEGFPVTIVEAQATGLSCLISDRISPECILVEELVEVCSLEESPEKWTEHIFKMLDSAEKHVKEQDFLPENRIITTENKSELTRSVQNKIQGNAPEETEGKEKETGDGRETYVQKIAAAGYGIQEAAQGMEQFYLKHWPSGIDVEKRNDIAETGIEKICL